MSKDDKKNIEFLPDKVKYNALKVFRRDIVKIPSYVIKEVFKRKLDIEIYHNWELKASYSWGSLMDNIKSVEAKTYTGKFRNEDISYNLNHVKICE